MWPRRWRPRSFAAPRGVTPTPDQIVTVVAEPLSNSLVVTASAANMSKVQALVDKLDTDAAQGNKPRAAGPQECQGPRPGQRARARSPRPPARLPARPAVNAWRPDASSNAAGLQRTGHRRDVRAADGHGHRAGPGRQRRRHQRLHPPAQERQRHATWSPPSASSTTSRPRWPGMAGGASTRWPSPPTTAPTPSYIASTTKAMFDQVSQWVTQVEQMKHGRAARCASSRSRTPTRRRSEARSRTSMGGVRRRRFAGSPRDNAPQRCNQRGGGPERCDQASRHGEGQWRRF